MPSPAPLALTDEQITTIMGRGKNFTTSDAVTALSTALGSEVAALVMRNPSLPIDETEPRVCATAQLTMRIMYAATPEATVTDAMAATAEALGIMIAMTARRGSAGFD